MSGYQDVNTPSRKRVLVVDNHEIVRRGWQFLISSETDLEVCGEAGTADQALELTEQLHPDVVVTCICLPGRTGLDLVKTLKTQHPHLPVLVVSTLDEKIFGERVLKAGGMGYLMKEAACEQLVIAVRQVLLGRYHVPTAEGKRELQTIGWGLANYDKYALLAGRSGEGQITIQSLRSQALRELDRGAPREFRENFLSPSDRYRVERYLQSR